MRQARQYVEYDVTSDDVYVCMHYHHVRSGSLMRVFVHAHPHVLYLHRRRDTRTHQNIVREFEEHRFLFRLDMSAPGGLCVSMRVFQRARR